MHKYTQSFGKKRVFTHRAAYGRKYANFRQSAYHVDNQAFGFRRYPEYIFQPCRKARSALQKRPFGTFIKTISDYVKVRSALRNALLRI